MAPLSKQALFKKIGYEPHPQQILYHNSTARFRLPNCGRRFGKSTMAGRDLEARLFAPNRLFWIVGPTYDLGEKEFRVVWHDLIVQQQLGKDKTIKRAYNKKQGHMFIQFPWNTRVEVRSADHPENLVGDALDWVIMSEAAKHKPETWERFIRPALADRRGGADFPTTPEGYNWLYDLWMYGQDPEVPEYESWRFPSWANTAIYPDGENDPEIRLLRKTMSPEGFLQEIGADFGSFVGKIYPEWDVQRHVSSVKFNPAWPNFIAFDWGYTNPLAAIEFQISPSDEIFVWREHYKSYTRVEEHCDILRRREQPAGYHLDLAFGDAADPEAAETVSRLLVPCIADPRAKSGSTPEKAAAQAGWREGIDLMRSFLEREAGEDEFGGPIYEPAFHVDYSCMDFIREMNNYKAPDSIKGKNVQEIGIRQDDHGLDALRYGLMHYFKLGATYSLADVITLNPLTVSGAGLVSTSSSGSAGFFTSDGGTF
jgi:hypothetical protein